MQLIYAFESWIIPPNLRNFNTLLPSRTLLWISSNFAREEVTSHRFHFLLFRLLRLGSNRALFIIVVVIPFKLLFFCAFSELVNLRTMAPMSRSRFFFLLCCRRLTDLIYNHRNRLIEIFFYRVLWSEIDLWSNPEDNKILLNEMELNQCIKNVYRLLEFYNLWVALFLFDI